MESVELSCIFGGNINCFSHLGKLFGGFNEVNVLVTIENIS